MTLQIQAIQLVTRIENDGSGAQRLDTGIIGLGQLRTVAAWFSLLLVAVAATWAYAATQSWKQSTQWNLGRGSGQAGSSHPWRASAGTRPFIGSWRLVSFEGRSPDGHVVHPMGEQPSGQLIYDARGQVSVQYMRLARPRFASGDLHQGTPEEIKAAFEGYIGYWGTYDVDDKARIVTHHVTGASFPNWVGGDQRRFYSFDHNHLTFRTPPILIGGVETTNVIVWERVK